MRQNARRIALVLTTFLLHGIVVNGTFAAPGADTPGAPKKVYYLDPVKGSTAKGNGTKSKPWGSLQSVVEAKFISGNDKTKGKIRAGDLLYLMTGNHGTISMWGPAYNNSDFITITAAPNAKPIINSLYLSNASKWVLRDLTFENPDVVKTRGALITADNSSQIIVDRNNLRSKPDVRRWTPKDWEKSSATYAIYFNIVNNSTISGNRILNVENGIYMSGDSILTQNNKIDYFANDGIQFTASNSIISRNWVTNHYGLWSNGYHHDGMQGWTAWNEKSTENVVIDGNIILASTNSYPDIPAVPTGDVDDYMQGIAIFDGKWDNLTVTNNVVAAAAYHGLSFYNISNSRIVNNTLIQQCPQFNTWLGVFGASKNVVVRNNIAHAFALPETGVTFDSNLAFVKGWQTWQKSAIPVASPRSIFVKFSPATAEFDFQLAPKSYAINRGSKKDFPARDILYRVRNSQTIDLGAYMYVAP